MGVRPHYLIDVLVGAVGLVALTVLWFSARYLGDSKVRFWTRWGLAAAAVVVTAAIVTAPVRISSHLPSGIPQWIKSLGLLISLWSVYAIPVLLAFKGASRRSPERRQFLKTAACATLAVPGVVTAAAFIQRNHLQFREFDVPIAGLPKDLQGLRIVQISDIHLGAFVSEHLLSRAVAMANEAKGHIALVTGDLISIGSDPLDRCLEILRGLKSDAGTYGCLGNHEIYAKAEDYTAREAGKVGMRFLRKESALLTFGDARLNLAGVDYQQRKKPYLVGAEALMEPGVPNILLSHNPDVFPVAAAQGYDLTIAGHTHGGQVNFEILHENVNIARFFTPYIYGRYQRGGKSLFVTRGIGTVGAPARLGAPPEVALIRLCAS